MKNTFQSLLCNACPLYEAQHRKNVSLTLSYEVFLTDLLGSYVRATAQHVARRREAIETIVASQHAKGSREYQIGLVVEALFDPHFRKQQIYGPSREYVETKIRQALHNGESLQLVGLMFTRKNICPLKRPAGDESHVDLAELSSLMYLNGYAQLLQSFYPHPVTYHILSEGQRFRQAFDICEPLIQKYQARIQGWIGRLGLTHLQFEDYEAFLARQLSPEMLDQRIQSYQEALSLYQSSMLPLMDMDRFEEAMQAAISCDPIQDARNTRNHFIPLWDSIKNSLPYPRLQEYAASMGVEYDHFYYQFFQDIVTPRTHKEQEELRRHVLERSWSAAIEHNARVLGDVKAGVEVADWFEGCTFRTSINPKPGNHLGIRLTRETTSRVQPWHGTAYLRTGTATRITVLSRLEIEQNHARPLIVTKEQESWCVGYVDAQTAQLIEESRELPFQASAR